MIYYQLKEPTLTSPSQLKRSRMVKVATDVHAHFYVYCIQEEGQIPKSPRKVAVAEYLRMMERMAAQHETVYSCYEAGPTGFALHRQLTSLGIKNVVIAPTCLDERRKKVNNDFTDTRTLASRLDRYVAGDPRAFTVVAVPSEKDEQRRTYSRQRKQMQNSRLAHAAQGRTLVLTRGKAISNNWWMESAWRKHQKTLPPDLIEFLETYRELILCCNQQIKKLEAKIKAVAEDRARERAEVAKKQLEQQEQKALGNGEAVPGSLTEIKPGSIPKWLGITSMEAIDAEIGDWNRFTSARKVGSYSGLTGGVSSSGESQSDLSITKSGNPRLRRILVEAAWRMALKQPDYWLTKKWDKTLGSGGKGHKRGRKKAIVAYARQLLVDLWRWRTGRKSAEQFGWKMT